ncbi:MAG TPA: hypothetical protein VJ808_07510, partial [Gemmatimonadales bacterium]|nr:hypothetical protein [Gemmatimonadales bacterium]
QVEAGNFQALYDAIRRLLSDRALATALGGAALSTARGHYSRDTVLAKYIELFNRVSAARTDA